MTEQSAPTAPDAPARTITVDLVPALILGVTTAAWYAVPDVLETRRARATAKSGILLAGTAAVATLTDDGRQTRDAVRQVRDALRGVAGDAGEAGVLDDVGSLGADVSDGNVYADDAETLTPVQIAPAGQVVVAGGLALVLASSVGVVVVGEKAAYRWGERMRARGARAPHTRVGLVMGAAAVLLAGIVPAPAADRA